MLKDLCHIAHKARLEYLRTTLGLPGLITATHTFSEQLESHPPPPAQMADGLFVRLGRFYVLSNGSLKPLNEPVPSVGHHVERSLLSPTEPECYAAGGQPAVSPHRSSCVPPNKDAREHGILRAGQECIAFALGLAKRAGACHPRSCPPRPFWQCFTMAAGFPAGNDARVPAPPEQRFPIGVAIAALGIVWLYASAEPSLYRGDERFYTDGALQMQATGDYWTPRWSDGSPRFQKPPLAYWLVVVSFRVFGANLWSARLPFVLAGLIALLLAVHLSRRWWRSPEAGIWTLAILASNITFYHVSVRSTPDILVVLFTLVSSAGWISLIDDSGARTRWTDYLMVWGGAAFTLLAKGLWGLAPAGVGLTLWARNRGRTWGEWIRHLVGAALATLPFIAWWVLMVRRHGASAWQVFWMDQVAERFDNCWSDPFRRALQYIGSVLRDFFPWSLLLLSGRAAWRWARREDRAAATRASISYTLALTALIWAVFSIGDTFRGRYLTAAYPLLAILLAGYLSEGAAPDQPRVFRLLRALPCLGHALAIGCLVLGVVLGPRAAAAGRGLAAGSEWARRRTRAARSWREFRPLAIAVSALFLTLEIGLQPLWQPAAAPRALAALRRQVPDAQTVIVDKDLGYVAAQLRLLSRNTLRVIEADPGAARRCGFPRLSALRRDDDRIANGTRIVDAGVLPSRAPLRFLHALWRARGDTQKAYRESGKLIVWRLPPADMNATSEAKGKKPRR